MTIKFVDLPTQYNNANMAAIMADIKDIVDTCGFVGGKYLSDFEANAAKYFNIHQTIGVGSGTDALILHLLLQPWLLLM
jgi:dTDP-4-amino-4,6-dideoxygalactose transaminase